MRKQFVSGVFCRSVECCSRNKLSALFPWVFLAGIIVFSGCTDITEFDAAFNGQLHIISAGDLSTINTISGISGARSLLIYPGNIFIASTAGVVYRYDSQTLAFVGEYQVDSPSPAGFFQMAMDQSASTAYLIGNQGKIVKFSLPDCIVLNVFSVCQSPVALAIAPGSPSYLYVGDGPTNTINQVSTGSNAVLASHDLEYPIRSIAVGLYADSIVVGTSIGTYLVEERGEGNLRVTIVSPNSCSSIDDIPGDTIYVVTTGHKVGVLKFYKDPAPGNPSAEIVGMVEVEGISHFVAAGYDWQHSYVLSYIGDNTSRLISYNHAFYRIDQQVEIPGFPLDLKVSGSNVIYALTYE